MTDKNLADLVESLVGCYLSTRGEISALRLLQWFNINCIPIDEHVSPDDLCKATNCWIKPKSPLTGTLATKDEIRNYNTLLQDISGLETIIGYKFNEKAYLLQVEFLSSNIPRVYIVTRP